MQPATVEIVQSMPKMPSRAADSNKGTFGRVLVAAGSRGMSGAAVLCATAALRAGAGLVRLAVPEAIQPIVASAHPCYTTAALDQDAAGRLGARALEQLTTLAADHDVVALGPGLGQSADIRQVVHGVLDQVRAPLILDADGLNAVGREVEAFRNRPFPLILTPHPGEFARLLGSDVTRVQGQRQDLASRFAAEHGVVLVLKGHGTLVTDGRRLYHNHTGNPGLATGGTGDVLTGMIAALVGQHLEPFAAAQLAVHVHGLAGDLARDHLGELSLIASDLFDYLPRAFRMASGV